MTVVTYDEQQLDSALRRLVEDGTLREDQADAVRDGVAAEAAPQAEAAALSGLAVATLAAAYVGVGLIVAAVGTLIGQNWDDMSVVTRSLVFAGITAVLVVAGFALRGRADTGRGLAWLVAVLSAGAFGAALLSGAGTPGERTMLAAGIAATVVAVPLLVLRPAAPQLLALVGALVVTAVSTSVLLHGEAIATGLTLWTLGMAVAAAGLAGLLPERLLAVGLGGLIALFGLHLVAVDALGLCALLALVLAVAAYTLSVREEPAVPLTVATLTVATTGPRILGDWLHGSLGASGVLAVSGVVVLAAAAVHVRLVRRRGDRATA